MSIHDYLWSKSYECEKVLIFIFLICMNVWYGFVYVCLFICVWMHVGMGTCVCIGVEAKSPLWVFLDHVPFIYWSRVSYLNAELADMDTVNQPPQLVSGIFFFCFWCAGITGGLPGLPNSCVDSGDLNPGPHSNHSDGSGLTQSYELVVFKEDKAHSRNRTVNKENKE